MNSDTHIIVVHVPSNFLPHGSSNFKSHHLVQPQLYQIMSCGSPSAKRAKKELIPLKNNVSVVDVGGYPVCEVCASTVLELKQKIEKVNGVPFTMVIAFLFCVIVILSLLFVRFCLGCVIFYSTIHHDIALKLLRCYGYFVR